MHASIETINDHQILQKQPIIDNSDDILSTMNSISNIDSNNNNDDAFDGSAEPIIYMSDNRIPVMIELSSTIIYIVFAALILALIFILPGVRKTKFTSLLGLLTLLTVGASILLALEGSQWLTGSIQVIDAPYSALTKDTITGRLEVNIGFSSVNVTLFGKLSSFSSANKSFTGRQEEVIKSVDYNERFRWDHPDKMYREHIEALHKGLPYPILTVTEFLSQDSEGFNWTRQLRQAGFYSSLALYTSLASWCLMTIVMCVLPIYLPQMMQITGAFMMLSVWVYTLLIQSPKSFAFQLGGNPIEFAFGYTYVTTFIAGAMSMFAGVLLFAIQMTNPHKQFTIMDSEQFVNDQKALYGNNLIQNQRSSSSQIDTSDMKNTTKNTSQRAFERSDSVIIPIADIEKNFQTSNGQSK